MAGAGQAILRAAALHHRNPRGCAQLAGRACRTCRTRPHHRICVQRHELLGPDHRVRRARTRARRHGSRELLALRHRSSVSSPSSSCARFTPSPYRIKGAFSSRPWECGIIGASSVTNTRRMKITHCLLIALSLLVGSPSHAGVWQTTSPMNTARGGAGVVEVEGRLYVIGGVDGIRFLSTSEYTTIQGDGSLSPWQKASTLIEEHNNNNDTTHKGYLYAVGGGNGPNGHNLLRSVERAAVLPDGKLSPWRREASQLNLPRRCAKVAVIGDYLYAFGGFGGTLLDTVERARIQRDGSLAAWEVLPGRFRMPRYIHAMAESDHALYAIGGHSDEGGTGNTATEYAALKSGKVVGQWQMSTPLKHGRYGLAALAHGDYVYAIGGLSGATFFDAIERSRVGTDGALGAWQDIAPLPAPFADIGVASYRDWLYVLGGTNRDGYFNSVFVTRIDPRGELVASSATATTAAPTPQPAKPVLVPNEGVVLQTIDGGAYTYVEVDTGDGREWLATTQTTHTPDDRVRYSLGIFMKDFYSKQLQRKFDVIRFVGKLEKADAQ